MQMQEFKCRLFEKKDRDFWKYGAGALCLQTNTYKDIEFVDLFVLVPKKAMLPPEAVMFPMTTRDCFLLKLAVGEMDKRALWGFNVQTLSLIPVTEGGKCSIGETPYTIHCEITDGVLRELP